MTTDHFWENELRFPPLPLMDGEAVVETDPEQATLTERYYPTAAVDFIKENRNGPFFLYLPHMYVHVPIFTPDEFLEKSDNGQYGAAVECLDWSTGLILDTLEDLGIAENTLVIFTSDNGAGGAGGEQRSAAGWEEHDLGGRRARTVHRLVAGNRAGGVGVHRTGNVDGHPADLREVGRRPNRRAIARSMVTISGRFFFGEAGATTPHEAFYYYHEKRLEAVRSGQWKLHFAETDDRKGMLIDLEADIGETTSVAAEHPDVMARLEDLAERCREELGDGDRPGAGCRPVGKVDNPQYIVPRPDGAGPQQ